MSEIVLTTEQLTDNVLTRLFNAGHPVMLEGGVGIGKTEIIVDFARRAGLGMVVEMVTAYDAPDVGGFMIPSKDENGRPVSRTTVPTWLRRVEDAIKAGFTRGILFLDEYKQGNQLVRKGFAQVKSSGEINGHKLPEGWVVWMTGNRSTDKSGTERPMAHDTNRQCTIEIQPSVQGWLKWADDRGVHPLITSFCERFPGTVFHANPSQDPAKPTCSPRSMMYAADYLTQGLGAEDALPSDPVSQTITAGFIGMGAAAEFFGFIKVREFLPTKEEIMEDPLTAKLPPRERLDAAYAVSNFIVHYADIGNIDTLFQYVVRLPRELQTSVAKRLMDKSGGQLLNAPSINTWLSENSALITSTLAS